MKKRMMIVAAFSVTSLNVSASILGSYTWKGGDGNWSDRKMWENGEVPPATDTRDPNDYYEIRLRPISNGDYVINLDQDVVYRNSHLKVLDVPGVVNSTITLSGGKTEFRQANGPGVNNCSYSGVNLQFKDCEVVLPGFNPYGGTITFGEGAKITSSASCYFSVAGSKVSVEEGADVSFTTIDTRAEISGSKFVVNGGKVSATKLGSASNNYGDFLYQFNGGEFVSRADGVEANANSITTIEINGGRVILPTINFNNSASVLRISGGELFAPKPNNAGYASVSFSGGYYGVGASSAGVFMTANDICYLPEGKDAVLDLHREGAQYASTWVSMLTSNTDNTDYYPDYRTNLLFSGTMLMTNETLAAFYTRGGDATPRVGNRGKLLFPIVFTRAKGESDYKSTTEFDLDLFALSRGIHAATPTLIYDFLNSVTIGAFSRDWSSMGYVDANNTFQLACAGPTMRFNGSVTFDTLDQLDKMSSRTIYLAKTAFNGVASMMVKGGGRIWMCATTSSPRVGELAIKDRSAFELAGKVEGNASNTNDIGTATLTADRIIMDEGAVLKVPADKVSIVAAEAEVAEGTTIEIDLQTVPTTGTIKKVVEISDGDNRATTVLTGAAAEAGWRAKSLAGLVYLSDNTTAAVTGHDAEWYWTGAEDGMMSVAGNWTTNTAPVVGAAFKPRFTGSRNMEIVNDLENWSCFNLYFTADCGPVSLSGNSLTLTPGGYGGETAAIYSASPYPVVINLDLARSGKFGIINEGLGCVEFNGKIDCGSQAVAPGNQYLVFKGTARIGGNVNAGAMLFFPKKAQGSVTKLTILEGGVLTLGDGDALHATNENEQTTVETPVWICSGSEMKVETCFNTGKCPLAMRVDGTLACESIAQSATDLILAGSGEVCVAGAHPSETAANVSKHAIYAGGTLTMRMSGVWNTVTSAKADYPQTLNINGDVKLVPVGDWRYGHDLSVATSTSPTDRAITIASGAKLTFAGGEGKAVLAEPIVGPGTLDFDPAAHIVPGGTLASAEWTTIADVGEVVNLPTMAEYKYRVVDGGENGKLLQAKGKPGIVIMVR